MSIPPADTRPDAQPGVPDPGDVVDQRDELRAESEQPADDVVVQNPADAGAPAGSANAGRDATGGEDDAGRAGTAPDPSRRGSAGTSQDSDAAPPAAPASGTVGDPSQGSPVNHDLE